MEKKTRKITDEHMQETTQDAVDKIAECVKDATRQVFDVFVERTAEVFSGMTDEVITKTKEKLAAKGNKDE